MVRPIRKWGGAMVLPITKDLKNCLTTPAWPVIGVSFITGGKLLLQPVPRKPQAGVFNRELRKWGHGYTLTLTKDMLAHLGLTNDQISMELKPGDKILLRKPTEEELARAS